MKTKKSELLIEKKEHNPVFDALRKIKVLEKPHQLYLNGYHEMQEEHDTYLKACDTLKSLGYETPEKIESLEKIKSNIEDGLSTKDVGIRELRKEIRLCNTALELNSHIEEKMQVFEELDKGEEQKRVTAKEVARNLLER